MVDKSTEGESVELSGENIGTLPPAQTSCQHKDVSVDDPSYDVPKEEKNLNQGSVAVFWRKAKKNLSVTKGLLPALFCSFVITFTVYPGVVQDTSLRFLSGTSDEESYFVLTTLTLFNIFDTIGRYVGGTTCA